MKKYGNYDLHPHKEIRGFEGQAFGGRQEILSELAIQIDKLRKEKSRVVVCFDLYPGADREEIFSLAGALCPDFLFDAEECVKKKRELESEFQDFMTQDRVFGILCHKRLEDLFDGEKTAAMRENIQKAAGLVVAAGTGAGMLCVPDLYIYGSVTRWEIQLRYRKGMPNFHMGNEADPILTKYKRGFFIEWRMADRYKNERFSQIDYLLETEEQGKPKMITGRAYRAGLMAFSGEPFRLEPYFDPGVWGGHWMQENFGLSAEEKNYAWSFDGVPEENAINMKFGNITVKLPAIDVVLSYPRRLLGERVHARFGAQFPIRFDLLDTMGGGNLSLQVHPLTEYIQDNFGMPYTQDESYYLLDTGEEQAYVYLGVQNGVDKERMAEDLEKAREGGCMFPADRYINKIPVKKHDHVLIPAGTIHCSGKDTVVLEISATPYIFTFKLWDWGRVGLDGIPRPIHVEHGLMNIQWERDTDYVTEQLVHQEKEVFVSEGVRCEKTGLHAREFIDTFRYTADRPFTVSCRDSVQMMNLVEGKSAVIESTKGEFEPFEMHYAETAVVPASVREYRVVPGELGIKLIVASVTGA